MNYQLQLILDSTQGIALSSTVESFTGFATDNRDPEISGKIFIPLKGDNHDAHNFVASAIENGATGALVHEWRDEWEALKDKATFIQVDDTLKALQSFSKAWRQRIYKWKPRGRGSANY